MISHHVWKFLSTASVLHSKLPWIIMITPWFDRSSLAMALYLLLHLSSSSALKSLVWNPPSPAPCLPPVLPVLIATHSFTLQISSPGSRPPCLCDTSLLLFSGARNLPFAHSSQFHSYIYYTVIRLTFAYSSPCLWQAVVLSKYLLNEQMSVSPTRPWYLFKPSPSDFKNS